LNARLFLQIKEVLRRIFIIELRPHSDKPSSGPQCQFEPCLFVIMKFVTDTFLKSWKFGEYERIGREVPVVVNTT
jgi:hypothetical protein